MKRTALLIAILLVPVMAFAKPFTNANALKGLETVKVVCDVNVGDQILLLRRMEMIDETYTQLIDAGIQPTFVVAFRGPAAKYVTRGKRYEHPGQYAIKKTIQEWIAQFHENGISLEQCAIAASGEKVSYSDILPQIMIVQNGFKALSPTRIGDMLCCKWTDGSVPLGR